MRVYLTLLASALVLAACQPGASPTTSPPSRAKFELRDFKVLTAEEDGRTVLKGRGTLISKEPSLAKGSFMVWLSVKKGHLDDREQRYTVVLTDGVGNLETRDGVTALEGLIVRPEFKEWKVLGFAPLLPGDLVTPGAERAASQ